jgi:hypothetical protein
VSRLIRILLVCLIAFALPAQGVAAVTMLHCDPARVGNPPGDAHAHHHHAAGLSTAPAAGQKNTGCTACAACCFGAATTSSVVALASVAPTHASRLALADDAASLGIAPEVLERPPRLLAA